MRMFFDRVVKVYRSKVTSGNKRSYQATATGEAAIQRLQDEREQLTPGVFGKSFKIWIPIDVSCQQGDHVKDENGVWYIVRAVNDNSFGATDFREVIVEKTEGPND